MIPFCIEYDVLDLQHIRKGDEVYSNPASEDEQQRRIPSVVHRQEGDDVDSSHHTGH